VPQASSAVVAAQLVLGDAVNLRLACTPLGTAFALTEGWAPTPSALPLRLHANRSVVAAVAEDLGASPDAAACPLFCCDELSSARVRPFFFSRQDLADTWVSAGRPAETAPTQLTVVDLRGIVQKMLAGAGIDWRTAMFIGSAKATAKAQEIQEAEARAKAAAADPEAEPPPLE
jgi:hypothetical protein